MIDNKPTKLNVKLGISGCILAIVLAIYFQTISFGTGFLFGMSLFFCFADLLFRAPASGKRTHLQKTFFGIIGFGAITFFWVEALVLGEMNTNDQEAQVEYAIVLGAGIKKDQPTPTLQMRLDKALEYLTANPDRKVIVSGGKGTNEQHTEAEVMKRYLVNNGIQANRVLKEEQATTTDENLKFAKDVVKKQYGEEISTVLIITSDFHMFRAKHIATQYYAHIYGITSKTPDSIRPIYLIREYFAYVKSLSMRFLIK